MQELSPGKRDQLRAESIGFVFQVFHLLPYLNLRDNILIGLSEHRPVEDGQVRVERLLDRFGIADRAAHQPCALSVGERQRVAMARALINDPSIVLADEPTGNLDDNNTQLVLNELSRVANNGTTVVMVTHDRQAAESADRIIRLSEGRVEAS